MKFRCQYPCGVDSFAWMICNAGVGGRALPKPNRHQYCRGNQSLRYHTVWYPHSVLRNGGITWRHSWAQSTLSHQRQFLLPIGFIVSIKSLFPAVEGDHETRHWKNFEQEKGLRHNKCSSLMIKCLPMGNRNHSARKGIRMARITSKRHRFLLSPNEQYIPFLYGVPMYMRICSSPKIESLKQITGDGLWKRGSIYYA